MNYTSGAIAVIDLDNCISDELWREGFCEMWREKPNDRYTKYHEACWLDAYCNKHIIDRIAQKHKIYVFTARPEAVRNMTEQWLRENGVPFEKVFMRGDEDHTPSVELKRKMLLELPDKEAVHIAIDDRSDVIQMYADEGVPICQRVFIHTTGLSHP